MKESDRHITWETFQTLMKTGVPTIHRLEGFPVVDLFYDPRRPCVGVRLPWSSDVDVPPSPYEDIRISKVQSNGHILLEVIVEIESKYQDFFLFALRMADRVQLEHAEVWGGISEHRGVLEDTLSGEGNSHSARADRVVR